MARNIIVHCHIFKNAGSTVDWCLKRSFGSAFCDHRDDVQMRQKPHYLAEFLRTNFNIAAFSSHAVSLPLPEIAGHALFPMVLIRHPIDRVGSVYSFERKQRAQTPGALNAKKLGFVDYVRWRMRPEIGATIRDFQVRFCAGKLRNPRQKIDQAMFEQADRFLVQAPMVGLVERFDESMVLFETFLRPIFPDIDLSYVAQNTSTERPGNLEERTQCILDELGEEASGQLLSNNQWDLKLHDSARRLVEGRMDSVRNFRQSVEEFRERCRRKDRKRWRMSS